MNHGSLRDCPTKIENLRSPLADIRVPWPGERFAAISGSAMGHLVRSLSNGMYGLAISQAKTIGETTR
jgi:hypothetical protein